MAKISQVQAAMILAAVKASQLMHVTRDGVLVNRREFRRRYKKRKGGGRDLGLINGLPKSSSCVAHKWNEPSWHKQNRTFGG